MIRRGVALALVWLAVAAPAVMAQPLETPPDPLVIVQSAIVRDVVEPGDLLAVGVYNIGSMTSPASQTGATFQARLVSGQGDLPGVATLAPFYDLATTSVDLSGTPDGWGYEVFSAYKPASVDAPGSGTVTITL